MKTKTVWLASLSSLALLGHALSEDYLGAEAVLAKVKAASASDAQKAPQDSAKQVATDLLAFQSAQGLSPDEAASQWLALLQRSWKVNSSRYNGGDSTENLNFPVLAKALPGPASWNSLATAVSQWDGKDPAHLIRKYALQWYFHRLTGDTKALLEDYDNLNRLPSLLPPETAGMFLAEGFLSPIESEMFQLSDDGAAILRLLERRLDLSVKPANPGTNDFADTRNRSMDIPDLVSLVGAEKAAAFLKKALVTYLGTLNVRGYETQKLAAKLALENVSKLKAPQWKLAESLEGGPLYQALVARFGRKPQDSSFQSARAYELVRLLAAGQTKEAVALSNEMTGSDNSGLPRVALEQLEGAGRGPAVSEFLHQVLSKNPNLPYWRNYIEVAVRSGSSEQMLALLQSTLDGKDLSIELRTQLEKSKADALLAVGRVDEGVAELMKIAQAPEAPHGRHFNYSARPLDIAETVARLGLALNRPDFIEQGLAAARAALREKVDNPSDRSIVLQDDRSLAKLLVDLGRGPEAEAVLTKALTLVSQPPKDNSSYALAMSLNDDASEILCSLVGLYTSADRSADVLTLLDNAPGWVATDLSQILDKDCYVGKRHEMTLGACAARALLRLGQKDKARPIVLALLDKDASSDRTYELLIEVDKAGAIPILDRLAAADPFQERPLIWKAKLLFDAGQLDEAEKTARAAVKIDPSDGETGPGDRMRVYAVLADILEAKGDAATAKVFRGAVQAIRLSEDADVFYGLGLVSQAVAMYEQALGYFADAYCIQSRLALRLLELGNWKGAEEHYRRAYELMPDSFGRVESHCFGCERAFAGEKQQSLAEKVFTKIATERPDNPQVHYLLGYLRYEQDRYKEALPEFQRAVELDPDYLNAWRKIQSISDEVHLPAAVRNSVATNILRLVGSNRHADVSLEGVTDLAAIWNIYAQQSAQLPPPLRDLYPLKGSAQALEAIFAKMPDPAQAQAFRTQMAQARSEDDVERTPGDRFARASFTSSVEMLLQMTNYLSR